MNRTLASLALILAASAAADDFLRAPLLGCIGLPDTSGRRVLGLRGTFLTEPMPAAALCSEQLALSASDEHATAARGEAEFSVEIGGGPRLLSLRGALALVVLPEDPRWLLFEHGHWRELPPPALANVAAVSLLARDRAGVVSRAEDGLWLAQVHLRTGVVERQRPLHQDAEHALVWAEETVLLANGAELILLRPDGSEERLTFDGDIEALRPTGGSWAAVHTATGIRALFDSPRGLEPFQLPGETGK